MAQIEIAFAARDELADAMLAAVKELGWDAATEAARARQQDLNDAIRGREGRHIRVEWVWALLNALPDGPIADRLHDALVRPVGRTSIPRVELTPEQRLERLEALLVERLGIVGAQLVEGSRR